MRRIMAAACLIVFAVFLASPVRAEQPAIDIEKLTNGVDADDPNAGDAPQIAVGDTVFWSYQVTNTGDTVLMNIMVEDDQGMPVLCPQDTLDPGDSMICTASAPAEDLDLTTSNTVPGLCGGFPGMPVYENWAEVYGTWGESGAYDYDPSHYCNAQEPSADCRVTAGGNEKGADGDHTWGGQARVSDGVRGNWTHQYRESEKSAFGFHSNDLFYVKCSDPGPFCDPARFAPARQIDFSGLGRFTHTKGAYSWLPTKQDLCFQVHLEDTGEPGRGGKWPISLANGLDCQHCPGTPIVNGNPDDLSGRSDCRDCTDYYEISIYDSTEHDDSGNCVGNLLWVNGSVDTDRCEASDPQLEGFFIRAGNVQIHPDNNVP